MSIEKRKDIIVDHERMYSVTSDGEGQLFLEIVYGGFAMDILIMPLSREEVLEFEARGKPALDDLRLRVLKDRARFEARFVE